MIAFFVLQEYDIGPDIHRLAEEYGKDKNLVIGCEEVSAQVREWTLEMCMENNRCPWQE